MSELRRDPITGRWVIVDTDNPTRPHEYEIEPPVWRPGTCPFCYGNENLTPPEIAVYRDPNTAPNTPGWQVRAVSNKFPALQIEGELDRRGLGMYDLSNGIGAHEVVVETPYHNKDLSDLTNAEVEDILRMLCQRSLDLAKDQRFKYIMIFKNFGPSAGASMEHPHTQMIALPMVPKNVKEELLGAEEYFDYRERCIFCDVIRQEISEKERIITDNKYFLAFCPYASRFPFEIWIMPKKHNSCFMHLNNEEIPFLAVVLKDIIARLKKVFDTPAYNFIIHTAPLDSNGHTDSYHWHLEFMPKLTRVAGFEWGTGFYVVPTPPEIAAKFLKEVKIE
ncbi:MAG: galactose-1-phosphate uridylyltransferase [Candidatus Omnitrophota bacterium]|jgi:UDPglucose--hexose-1-phosphate uridylyltransferase